LFTVETTGQPVIHSKWALLFNIVALLGILFKVSHSELANHRDIGAERRQCVSVS